MSVAERIEFQLLLAKLTPARRQLVKTVLLATLNAQKPTGPHCNVCGAWDADHKLIELPLGMQTVVCPRLPANAAYLVDEKHPERSRRLA